MIAVTPCGSGKYKSRIFDVANSLRTEGFVTLAPTLISMDFVDKLEPSQALLAWKGGTYSHLQRIKRCDICLICNFDGYSGVGTTLELGYAAASGCIVVALRDDEEHARQSIFDHVLNEEDPVSIASMLRTYTNSNS